MKLAIGLIVAAVVVMVVSPGHLLGLALFGAGVLRAGIVTEKAS